MTDFLLELLSEEIPARMQDKARDDLARLFADEIAKAGLRADAIETYATPRRLALIARNLPLATQAVSEEIKGPREDAPSQAIDGFLRKHRLSFSQLSSHHGVLFAVIERPGRSTAEVLAEAIPAIVRGFPWPKSMRWGDGTLRWVRPLSGIVALLGEEPVPVEIDGIRADPATVGHRFHHPGVVTIGSAADYAAKLRACHVIIDQDERCQIIRDRAAALAADAGLSVIFDEGLVAENAGLTEWPVPLLGAFDPAFLELPREVIQLTMRTNQKYFALADEQGALAPNFICTANIDAADGGAGIVAGNAKVLSARLSDARFFWEQDLKVPLEEQAKKLSGIVFHEKLGTVADKVERVAKLARWLVKSGVILPGTGRGTAPEGRGGGGAPQAEPLAANPLHHPADGPPPRAGEDLADLAERAARLCKADLVTGMVGEFPELQGIMGGYIAAAQGEHPAVAAAIRDHYKPVGQGDDVPTDPVTVAVSLADRLDTLVSFFLAQMQPTGSKDPFALRRAALGVIGLTTSNCVRVRLTKPLAVAATHLWDQQGNTSLDKIYQDRYPELSKEFATMMAIRESIASGILSTTHMAVADIVEITPENDVVRFLVDRLKVQQREAGVRHDLIDAVFALGGEDDLVRLLARVKALQAFVATEDGANLLSGYKRAANILRIEEKKDASAPLPGREGPGVAHGTHDGSSKLAPTPDPSLPGRGEEAALVAALDAAEPAAASAVEGEQFEEAMRALAALRAPIDAFFDKVTVNDPDPAKRAARLALLARVRDAVHRVADFSRIEG